MQSVWRRFRREEAEALRQWFAGWMAGEPDFVGFVIPDEDNSEILSNDDPRLDALGDVTDYMVAGMWNRSLDDSLALLAAGDDCTVEVYSEDQES